MSIERAIAVCFLIGICFLGALTIHERQRATTLVTAAYADVRCNRLSDGYADFPERLHESDYFRLSDIAGDKWEERPTLFCRAHVAGELHTFVAKELWIARNSK